MTIRNAPMNHPSQHPQQVPQQIASHAINGIQRTIEHFNPAFPNHPGNSGQQIQLIKQSPPLQGIPQHHPHHKGGRVVPQHEKQFPSQQAQMIKQQQNIQQQINKRVYISQQQQQ